MTRTAFSGLFQLGYVTRDMRQTEQDFREWYGIQKLLVNEVSFDATTSAGAGVLNLVLGFAYVDDVMIEIIQPVSGSIDIYVETMNSVGPVTMLHHVASRINGDIRDWQVFRASIDVAERRVALEGGVGDGLRFIYVDDRQRLGHYVEYIWFSEPFFRGFTKNMPRY